MNMCPPSWGRSSRNMRGTSQICIPGYLTSFKVQLSGLNGIRVRTRCRTQLDKMWSFTDMGIPWYLQGSIEGTASAILRKISKEAPPWGFVPLGGMLRSDRNKRPVPLFGAASPNIFFLPFLRECSPVPMIIRRSLKIFYEVCRLRFLSERTHFFARMFGTNYLAPWIFPGEI